MKKHLWLALMIAGATTVAFAAEKNVTLDVRGMTCATCPITVKKALSRVKGVSRVDVDYDKRQAVVIFDDAKTNVGALTRATADAGYPSTVKKATR